MTRRPHRLWPSPRSVAFSLALLALATWPSAQAEPRPNWINVKDYIEKIGPIKNISVEQRTAAIREAASAKGGVLFFPPGSYTINDTIDFRGKSIVGEGATIAMTDPEKDILFSKGGYKLHVEGLAFKGGKNQLTIDTGGIGGGIFYRVNDCAFHDAAGFALYVHVNMTHMIVERVEIKKCAQGVFAQLDSIIFRDSHSNSGRTPRKPFFEFRCPIAKIDDCLLTPNPGAADQRWIDNYCLMLILKDTRFGGEGGGFTPVVNFTGLGNSRIAIENCFLLNQSNNKRKCAVYCEQVPNTISIRDSWMNGCAAILVSPALNLTNYFVNVRREHLGYTVENCTGYMGDIPEGLKNPVILSREPDYLTDEQLKPFLDAAEKRLAETNAVATKGQPFHYKNDRPSRGPAIEHVQQTDAAKFVEAVPPNCEWVVEGCADSEFVTNDKYFGVRVVGDDVILITRQAHTGNAWVLVKGITVDLDKFPLLTVRMKMESSWRTPHYRPFSMRIIDRETGLDMPTKGDGLTYTCHDLREAFGGGVHTFDIKVYYGPWTSRFVYPDLEEKYVSPPPGTYGFIDFIRFEAE